MAHSEPLGPAELRGHVVLVNFWTWTCINWLRQEPYVRAWSQAYRDDGLVVVGVHTAEFSFGYDIEGVRRATKKRAIDYAKLERVIQRLLGVERQLVSAKAWAWRRRPTGTICGRGRPISARGAATALRRLAAPRSTNAAPYELPRYLSINHWALVGEWTIGPENVVLDEAGGSIAFRFHARDAHLVCRPGTRAPIPFRVLVDGEPPGPSHGVGVDADGNGVLHEAACTNSCASTTRSATARSRSRPRARHRSVLVHVRVRAPSTAARLHRGARRSS